MFNYVCLGTNNLRRSAHFYDATLAELGYVRCRIPDDVRWEGWMGWGADPHEEGCPHESTLWLCLPFNNERAVPGNGVMIALWTGSWSRVRSFHSTALMHGGTCAGKPGLRVQYGKDFYAAYVRDPDGNKLAAVCRGCNGDASANQSHKTASEHHV